MTNTNKGNLIMTKQQAIEMLAILDAEIADTVVWQQTGDERATPGYLASLLDQRNELTKEWQIEG